MELTSTGHTLALTLIGVAAVTMSVSLLELAYSVYSRGIGPTPSGMTARRALAQLCVQEYMHTSHRDTSLVTVYELGSGWGGLTHIIAAHLEGVASSSRCEVVGYEMMWGPHLVSRLVCSLMSVARHIMGRVLPHQRDAPRAHITPRFVRGDLIRALDRARAGDLFVCYLCPEQMTRIIEHVHAQRSVPSITLISLTFAAPTLKPSARYILPTLYHDSIYIYHLEAKRA